MTSDMALDKEEFPMGVHRRKESRKLYFEVRNGKRKLYSAKIETMEEGALCHDIVRRYSERQCCVATPGGERGKRKAPHKLNFPGFSPSLVLEDLPTDFDNQDNKERAMEVILKQARAAAKDLLEHAQPKSPVKVQKHLAMDVGSQRIDYVSSSNAHRISPCGAKFFEEVGELINQCRTAYASKVSEREALERTVNGIKEDMGIICVPNCGLDNFHENMARLKYLVSGDGGFSRSHEVEQEYKSEESKCWKLRKIVEDHNLKSIPESLTSDGNTMTGRRRANETERPPPVLEICPTEDENNLSKPIEDVSACCDPPPSPLVPDVKSPGEESNTMLPVLKIVTTLPVESDEFALLDEFLNNEIQFTWEKYDELPAEFCRNGNIYNDQCTPGPTDDLFSYDDDFPT